METCYKAFRREVIQSIRLEENRFGFEPEVTVKVAKRRLRVYEVGISYSGRAYEEGKKIGWKDGLRAIVVLDEVFDEGTGAAGVAGNGRESNRQACLKTLIQFDFLKDLNKEQQEH